MCCKLTINHSIKKHTSLLREISWWIGMVIWRLGVFEQARHGRDREGRVDPLLMMWRGMCHWRSGQRKHVWGSDLGRSWRDIPSCFTGARDSWELDCCTSACWQQSLHRSLKQYNQIQPGARQSDGGGEGLGNLYSDENRTFVYKLWVNNIDNALSL